jgi:hypothetical protein
VGELPDVLDEARILPTIYTNWDNVTFQEAEQTLILNMPRAETRTAAGDWLPPQDFYLQASNAYEVSIQLIV